VDLGSSPGLSSYIHARRCILDPSKKTHLCFIIRPLVGTSTYPSSLFPLMRAKMHYHVLITAIVHRISQIPVPRVIVVPHQGPCRHRPRVTGEADVQGL
jgi:hypothetical protein